MGLVFIPSFRSAGGIDSGRGRKGLRRRADSFPLPVGMKSFEAEDNVLTMSEVSFFSIYR